jgi:transcriptional repressor NrdR
LSFTRFKPLEALKKLNLYIEKNIINYQKMGVVVKKGGKRQAFSPSKVRNSVIKAAMDAKYAMSRAKELAKEVADPVIEYYRHKRSVKASQIRKSLLARLDRKAKSVSASWRRYDKNI